MTITCQHWTAIRDHGACALGRFGGRPSLGTCRLVCQLGTAPYTEPVPGNRAEPLLAPSAVPGWPDLRAQIAAVWPAWLPEFDAARLALAGCTTCEDTARRARWAERLAALSTTAPVSALPCAPIIGRVPSPPPETAP